MSHSVLDPAVEVWREICGDAQPVLDDPDDD